MTQHRISASPPASTGTVRSQFRFLPRQTRSSVYSLNLARTRSSQSSRPGGSLTHPGRSAARVLQASGMAPALPGISGEGVMRRGEGCEATSRHRMWCRQGTRLTCCNWMELSRLAEFDLQQAKVIELWLLRRLGHLSDCPGAGDFARQGQALVDDGASLVAMRSGPGDPGPSICAMRPES
jgi:hypothetical protein